MIETTKQQAHSQGALLYVASIMLERASYYGLRSIIILYMIGKSMKMETEEALSIYGFLTTALLFSGIIGAVLGDLLIGNKKSIIIGGIMQALGAFCFCIPTITGLYIGMSLVVLGSGLYSPNVIANFGKLYLTKTKLLDAGFTLFYFAINLGTFLGILLIGYLGNKYGWNVGFIVAGLLTLLSIIPILISKEEINEEIPREKFHISKRILNILIAFILVTLFWTIYEISSYKTFDLQYSLKEISTLDIPESIWNALNAIFIIPISVIAIIIWTYLYSSQISKIMLAFVFGVISFRILLLIPEVPTEQSIIVYLVSVFFLCLAEIHIAPIILSVLTKYTNPKYIAILVSLVFIPTRLSSILLGLFSEQLYENPNFSVKIGLIVMIVISLGLSILLILKKKINTINKYI